MVKAFVWSTRYSGSIPFRGKSLVIQTNLNKNKHKNKYKNKHNINKLGLNN